MAADRSRPHPLPAAGASAPSEGASPPAAPEDRPRERLLSAGPRALWDFDLVALLIGTGTGRLSACAAVSAIARRRGIPAAVRPHDQAAAEVSS